MFMDISGIDNVRDLEGQLERAVRRVGADGAKVVRRSAAAVERLAKQGAPVDTGHLRESISTEYTGSGRATTFSAEIGPTAAYGAYVEFGTSRHGPQPYMFPAGDRVEPEFTAAFEKLADPGV